MPVQSGLDRSTAFTILLTIEPEFGGLEASVGRQRVTDFLADWGRSTATDMYVYAKEWVRHHPIEEASP